MARRDRHDRAGVESDIQVDAVEDDNVVEVQRESDDLTVRVDTVRRSTGYGIHGAVVCTGSWMVKGGKGTIWSGLIKLK